MRDDNRTSSVSLVTGHPELSDERRHLYDVVELVDSMHRRAATDFEAVLRELNAVTVESVSGAQYASVTVVDDTVQSLAATHPYLALLDEVQRDVGEGPCLSAGWDHQNIIIEDLSTETRWPRYREAALARTPVRSILSFRLHNEGSRSAALNLCAEAAYAFDEEAIELGLIFAAHTTVAWNVMRRHEQFRSALASRDVIGQAKGILMERFDINAMAAFDLLREISQESNTKLVDVAERLVNLEHPSR
nr:GAF and ANTAR domain-containing protein [Mycolicibacterium austroafricanum]